MKGDIEVVQLTKSAPQVLIVNQISFKSQVLKLFTYDKASTQAGNLRQFII